MKKFMAVLTVALMVVLLTACGGGGGGGNTDNPDSPNPPADNETITANFGGAVALSAVKINRTNGMFMAIGSEEDDTTTTIVKTDDEGNVSNALETTVDVDVKSIQNGPDGIYVMFGAPVQLNTGSDEKFALIKVASNGTITGIDSSMERVQIYPSGGVVVNPPLQWDESGRMYYTARFADDTQAFRMWDGSTVTDIIPASEDPYVINFLVVSNGIIVDGTSMTAMTSWVRHYNLDGTFTSIQDTNSSCLYQFQGQVIFTADTGNIYTYDPSEKTVSLKPEWSGFIGPLARSLAEVEGRLFGIVGNSLYQLYPSVEDITPEGFQATMFDKAGIDLVVAGIDDSGNYRSYLVETVTHIAHELMVESDYNINITHIGYVDGKIVFDGLNIDSGKVVSGINDPVSGDVSLSEIGTEQVIATCLVD